MDCFSTSHLLLFNEKAIQKFGGLKGIRDPGSIESFEIYTTETGKRYGFDDIELTCFAVVRIAKGHYFSDGNKRTAQYILLNCLKKHNLKYTGRQIDLSRKIETIAGSKNSQKDITLDLAYFLKSRLQTR